MCTLRPLWGPTLRTPSLKPLRYSRSLASFSFSASCWLAILRSMHSVSAARSPMPGMLMMGTTCQQQSLKSDLQVISTASACSAWSASSVSCTLLRSRQLTWLCQPVDLQQACKAAHCKLVFPPMPQAPL